MVGRCAHSTISGTVSTNTVHLCVGARGAGGGTAVAGRARAEQRIVSHGNGGMTAR